MTKPSDLADQFSPRVIWDEDGSRVSIRRRSSGGVQFDIRNLTASSSDEIEYVVSDDRTWDLIDELGGEGDPIDLVEANIKVIMQAGVAEWLRSAGLITGHRQSTPIYLRELDTERDRMVDDEVDAISHNTTRQVWDKNGLHVSVSRTVDGGLRFDGLDSNPNPFGDSDYEYALTVRRADVSKIMQALDGTAHDDPIELIAAEMKEIVHIGEMTWLRSLGIEPRFWSHP